MKQFIRDKIVKKQYQQTKRTLQSLRKKNKIVRNKCQQEKVFDRNGADFGQPCSDSEFSDDEVTSHVDLETTEIDSPSDVTEYKNEQVEGEEKEEEITSIRKRKFAPLVYEVSDELYRSSDSPVTWTCRAIEALQCSIEEYVTDLFQSANLCAFHRNSDVIGPQDLQLASALTDVHICSANRDNFLEHKYKNENFYAIIDLEIFDAQDSSNGCR